MEYRELPEEYGGSYAEETGGPVKKRKKKLLASVLAPFLAVAMIFYAAGTPDGPVPGGDDGPTPVPPIPSDYDEDIDMEQLLAEIPDWYCEEEDLTVHFGSNGQGWIFNGTYFGLMDWSAQGTEAHCKDECSYGTEDLVGPMRGAVSWAWTQQDLHASRDGDSYILHFLSTFSSSIADMRPLDSIDHISTEVVDECLLLPTEELVSGAWEGMLIPETDHDCPFVASLLFDYEYAYIYETDTEAMRTGYRESYYEVPWTTAENNRTVIEMIHSEPLYYDPGSNWSYTIERDLRAYLLITEKDLILMFDDFDITQYLLKIA